MENAFKKRIRLASFVFLGIVLLLALAFWTEGAFGLPSETTLRVALAIACLVSIYHLGQTAFPGRRWPQAALLLSLLVNVGIFFTPLVDRPTSRGELMIFALPDAVIFLTAWLASVLLAGPASDDHQRAVRQQLILGLVLAVTFCTILFPLILMQPPPTR